MDVFSFHDRVVEDYGQFSRSFTQIKASDLQQFVDGSYGKGEYWPSPLIQLNPSFVSGGAIGELVEAGLLHPECSRIFRWGKDNGPGQEATAMLRSMVGGAGAVVTLMPQQTDRYSRTVAEVFAGGQNVNLEMVRQGQAYAYR